MRATAAYNQSRIAVRMTERVTPKPTASMDPSRTVIDRRCASRSLATSLRRLPISRDSSS
jgi:hypothetical protein